VRDERTVKSASRLTFSGGEPTVVRVWGSAPVPAAHSECVLDASEKVNTMSTVSRRTVLGSSLLLAGLPELQTSESRSAPPNFEEVRRLIGELHLRVEASEELRARLREDPRGVIQAHLKAGGQDLSAMQLDVVLHEEGLLVNPCTLALADRASSGGLTCIRSIVPNPKMLVSKIYVGR